MTLQDWISCRSLLAIFAVFIAIGTGVDLRDRFRLSKVRDEEARTLRKRQQESWQAYLVGFSFYTNSIRLLDTRCVTPFVLV